MTDHDMQRTSGTTADLASLRTVTMVVYGLQAASFLIGLTFVIAVIVNYVKQGDVRGTWLESHFRWQIRTFWFGLLWFVVGMLTAMIFIGYLILVANTIWIIYRIVRGWLRLMDNRSMDLGSA